MGIFALWRLARAGLVLAREGAFSLVQTEPLPGPAKFGIGLARLIERRSVRKTGRVERLTRALNRLGPTYVKFGQTLGTRPDIVGAEFAADLSGLQDDMEPFDAALVPGLLQAALGDKAATLSELSPPIAAASIAQVHKATLTLADGRTEVVAVKLLRPGIEARFRRDLESFYAGARFAERFMPALRRLRPVDVVKTLDQSAKLELDLRFEAASISEFAENIEGDDGFRIPDVRWEQTAQRVLTTSWIEGVPIRNLEELDAAGIDRKKLAALLMQSFLRHAIRDGFFHADMHPGNLFGDPKTGGVAAVDFGIMGRIGPKERRFLAEVLYGFITRNYRRMAKLHIAIGYVPDTQSVDDFALALRAIGEPMHGRRASDISMANVLGQLFAVTELFDMQARPELVLLQKNMVLVEGVGRMLDPELDIWTVAEPFVSEWVKREAGPAGRIEAGKEHFDTLIDTLGRVPGLVRRADALLQSYEQEAARPRRGWFYVSVTLAAVLVVGAVWSGLF